MSDGRAGVSTVAVPRPGTRGQRLAVGLIFSAAIVMFMLASAVTSFLFIPHYPFWSLTIIALDVLGIDLYGEQQTKTALEFFSMNRPRSKSEVSS
jgi:hypothetical protein